jgi:hypothetical protein
MVIKTSHGGKLTRNTAHMLSVSKIPHGKNEWWKKRLESFLCLTRRFYGYYDTTTVELYSGRVIFLHHTPE